MRVKHLKGNLRKKRTESRKETNGMGNRAAEVDLASGRSAFHHFLNIKL